MHLSWSHKLFFKINAQVGKRPWLDGVMIFCAKHLIFIMAIVWWLSLVPVDWSPEPGTEFFGPRLFRLWEFDLAYVGVEVLVALVVSYVIGFLWKHQRPIVELPEVKELFRPLTTWKSFPSDHTLIAFLIAFNSIEIGNSGRDYSMAWGIAFVISAVLVAIGRVYAGVHYPRDIVGGVLVASIVILLFRFIFLGVLV